MVAGEEVDKIVIGVELQGFENFEKNIKRMSTAISNMNFIEAFQGNKALMTQLDEIGVTFRKTGVDAGKLAMNGGRTLIEFSDVMEMVQLKGNEFRNRFINNLKDVNKSIRQTGDDAKWFQMQWLGVMFLGLQLQRTFGGLIQPLTNAMETQKIWGETLESILEPLEPILEKIEDFMMLLEDMPYPLKILISAIIALGYIFGTMLFYVGQTVVGLLSFGKALDINVIKITKFAKSLLTIRSMVTGLVLGAFLMSGAFDELFEMIGDILEPIVDNFIDFLDIIEEIADSEAGPALIVLIGSIGAVALTSSRPLTAIVIALGTLDYVLGKIKDSASERQQAIIGLGAAITGIGIALATLLGIISAPITAAILIIVGLYLAWDRLKEVWKNFWSVIKPYWDEFIVYIDKVFGGFGREVSKTWNIIEPIWELMKKVFNIVFPNPFTLIIEGLERIKKLFADVKRDSEAQGGGVIATATSFLKRTGSMLWDAMESLNPWKGAEGGIITRPSLGLAGEAGPEALIPLDKMGNMGTNIGNININVSINGTSGLNERQLADRIGDVVIQKFRNTITR